MKRKFFGAKEEMKLRFAFRILRWYERASQKDRQEQEALQTPYQYDGVPEQTSASLGKKNRPIIEHRVLQ